MIYYHNGGASLSPDPSDYLATGVARIDGKWYVCADGQYHDEITSDDLRRMADYIDKKEGHMRRIPHGYTLDDYQSSALTTAIYPDQGYFGGVIYATLGLAGEAGEISNKVKKLIRDKLMKSSDSVGVADAAMLADELGDVLWYVAVLADELGYNLSEIAEGNATKLRSRQERGKLGGSGDNR